MNKPIISKLIKSSIFKNLSVLVSGTIIAQIIVIGFQVVLRRIYTPQEFGAFAVYMSMLGILATISSFRYEQTIMLPKSKLHAWKLSKLSIFIALVFSGLLLLLVFLFPYTIFDFMDFSPEFIGWLYFLPASVFIFSVAQILNFFLIKENQYKVSASNKVYRRSSEGVLQGLMGLFNQSIGLIIGDFIGQFFIVIRSWLKIQNRLVASTLICAKSILYRSKLGTVPSEEDSFVFSPAKPVPDLLRKDNDLSGERDRGRTKRHGLKTDEGDLIEKVSLKELALRYSSFPLKNGIPALMNAISLLLPVIIINRKFIEEVTGYFDLARMVLILPLSLVTASLSQVLLQQFSEKRNRSISVKKDVFGTLIPLVIGALFFGLIIQFFGPYIFRFIFGEIYYQSGMYASILVWAFMLKFVVSPFNIVFTAFEKIGILSLWQTFYFILILILNWLPFSSIESFLYAYLIIELISYGIAGVLNTGVILKYEKGLSVNNIDY